MLTDPAGHQLSYSLPFTLPAPTVSGNTALYSSVLPDVDLSVSATDQGGISDVLIVHSASAATNPDLAKLTMSTSTEGLALSTDAEGDLDATAADGSLSYIAPKPVMWDSSTSTTGATASDAGRVRSSTVRAADSGGVSDAASSTAAGPGAGAQVDPVAMSVSGSQIALTPDESLLTGSGTQYPVFIDPSINPEDTAKSTGYDEVYQNSECSGQPEFDVPQQVGEGVGYQGDAENCGTGLERSFYTLSLAGIPSNAQVSSSKIIAGDTFAASWNCSRISRLLCTPSDQLTATPTGTTSPPPTTPTTHQFRQPWPTEKTQIPLAAVRMRTSPSPLRCGSWSRPE
ncbi:hypothetical protein GXW82_23875 [Streptacidiphilus sp. 4-A2]|nr:hypothetical protein [Streptacidiphilus sp. 4-A2]